MINGQYSMVNELVLCLKFLHACYESVAAFDGLGVVARSAETTNRTVTLHANHTLRGCEVEEVLLQLLVLVSHDEADVHQ